MKTAFKKNELMLLSIKTATVLSALEAISIGPIPITWLAAVLPVAAATLFGAKYKTVPITLFLLFFWAIAVQGFYIFCIGVGSCTPFSMPPLSTTPYIVFIALRFLPFAMLIAVIAAIEKLQDSHEEIRDFIVRLGCWISGIALYVYVAQLTGLPDIPRTRLGTDGLSVLSVQFTYAFHRALGTFREPSDLAVWLMLPLFFSLRAIDWRTYLIGGAIVLSGSMTAFVAVAGGAVLGAFFLLFKTVKKKAWLVRIPIYAGLAVVFSSAFFFLLAQTNDQFSGLLSLIMERLIPVASGGIQESNRGYVFIFAEELGIPIFGYGLGNINLVLTQWQGGDAVSGILSLYLNFLLGLGVFGFGFLAAFLSRPLLWNLSGSTAKDAYPLYAAYFAWLTTFIIHAAEFPFMFALTYGLMIFARQRTRIEPLHHEVHEGKERNLVTIRVSQSGNQPPTLGNL